MTPRTSVISRVFQAAVVLIVALAIVRMAMPPDKRPGGLNIQAFAKLPVVDQGRTKPFDSLARTSLMIISDRQEFEDAAGKKQPAIVWLLDVISNSPEALKHPVFRIENQQLLDLLGLEARSGFRYGIEEFREKFAALDEQSARLASIPQAQRDTFDNKLEEFLRQLHLYQALSESFSVPPTEAFQNPESLKSLIGRIQKLKEFGIPHAVPPHNEQEQWAPFIQAAIVTMVSPPEQQNPAVRYLATILGAWQAKDAEGFNGSVARYSEHLSGMPRDDLSAAKLSFEWLFNNASPFIAAAVIYVIVFLLAVLGWLAWPRTLNNTAMWLVVLALVIHTAALIGRIYLSGRPPVTNLYSSAVFIGWCTVLAGLIFEVFWRIGIGNVIAGVTGFATLLIAHHLSADDTLKTLEAVLDTNFWLATHVTTVTMGYGATYVAGLLGTIFILGGAMTRAIDKPLVKLLGQMMYGTLCFALLFSFVGTVLGGLWADDSWGRFWGWDPKENGALIIVLWNAIVLHARWDGLIQQRGMATLAVAGNIVTTWSWFGVNQLGVGLHSYGFTDGVFRALMVYVASQIVLIGVGCMPRHWWTSPGISGRALPVTAPGLTGSAGLATPPASPRPEA